MNTESTIRPLLQKPKRRFSGDFQNYLRLLRLEVSHPLPPYLENDAMFLYVESGHGRIVINGQEFAMKTGTFCYLQNYHVFQLESDSDSPLQILACIYDYQLSAYFPISSAYTSKQYDHFFNLLPIVQTAPEQWETILQLFQMLEDDEQTPCSWSQMARAAILGQIMVEWSRVAYEQKRKKQTVSTAWTIWTFISKFNGSNMTAGEVTSYFGKSVATMNRELRAISGYQFNQLLNRARVGQACTGILLGNTSFRYIAAYAGFRTEASFYRAFVEYRGMTPQKYRENMLNTNGVPRFIMNDLPVAIFLHILNHYREPLSVADAAGRFFVTEAAVNAALKTVFGETFQTLLLFFRLRYAKVLLEVTDIPILDIALNSGWSSVYTFIRQFKQKCGMTPSEFRRRSHQ